MKRLALSMLISLSTITVAASGENTPKPAPREMDKFITELMGKMTIEEKIGQLNLPVSGEITTGQAKSSDVAQKIEQGLVGGLFNLKGVEKIRDVQKLAIIVSFRTYRMLFSFPIIAL